MIVFPFFLGYCLRFWFFLYPLCDVLCFVYNKNNNKVGEMEMLE